MCCLRISPVNSMGRPSKNFLDKEGNLFRPCSRCGEAKPIASFSPKGPGSPHHVAACKSCMSKLCRKGYYKNLVVNREKARGYLQRGIRAEKARYINEIKANTPCSDCKKCFPPICMDFDHLPGSEKAFSISLSSGFSLEQVKAEIAKCEIVCANCHRIRTSNRPKYRK